MAYQNSYTIEVLANENLIETDPAEFSFSLRDSIHNFFNTATFRINDSTTLFHEALINQEGVPYEINYGYIDEELKLPFVVDHSETKNSFTTGLLNGPIDMELVHAWRNIQEAVSSAYEGEVSDIVEEILNPDLSDVLIESTVGGSDTWYRPYYTESDFVTKILLPNAYSPDSNDSPYFAFIDSKNRFHFESYFTLFDSTPVATFVQTQSQSNNYSRNIVADLKPFTSGIKVNYPHRNRKVFHQDSETGEFEFEENSILDFPSQRGSFPDEPFLGNASIVTGMFNKGYETPDDGSFKEARKFHSMRESYFSERFLVTLSGLNTTVTAGNTINLEILVHGEDGKVLSDYWTGKYLVESSDHVWNGENQNGFSQFVISRRGVKYPGDSLIGEISYGV